LAKNNLVLASLYSGGEQELGYFNKMKNKLKNISRYINHELNSLLGEWLKTEKEVREEGGEYDAKDRMRNQLTRAIDRKNINSALQNIGNYNWLDYFLSVAGQGLFIDEEFTKKANEKALKAITKWKIKNL